MQANSNSSEIITPKILSTLGTKCVSGTSFSPQKQRRRERCLTTMRMKEIIRAVPGCFIGRRQPRNLEENIAELSLCFSGRGRAIVWTGSKRCENGGAGIFTPRVCAGGLHATFFMSPIWQHHLVEVLKAPPSLAGLGLHLTQLWVYKDNGNLEAFNKQQRRG